MSKPLGGYYGAFDEQDGAQMDALENASSSKRLEPADPQGFMDSVSQHLRDYQEKYTALKATYNKLSTNASNATVGLKRLESLTIASGRFDMNSVREAYRQLLDKDKIASTEVDRCGRMIEDVKTASQFMSSNLMNPLADKHKKVGMQQEMHLRLQDIENQLDKTKRLLDNFATASKGLTDNITTLVERAGIKLPPAIKDENSKDDKIQQIILQNQKKLKKDKPTFIAKLSGLGSFGDTESPVFGFVKTASVFAIGALIASVILNKVWK